MGKYSLSRSFLILEMSLSAGKIFFQNQARKKLCFTREACCGLCSELKTGTLSLETQPKRSICSGWLVVRELENQPVDR
jgi:hypothetical protein